MFKVILDSIPTHSCYCYFYYWPQHRIEYLIMGIGDQNSKQPMPRFDKKKQRSKPFSKKRTSAKKSVQKISCSFKFVLFLSFLLPPLSPVWHRTIWKKEISNMWFCSLVVFAYLALFFVDDWSVPHTCSHLVTPGHTYLTVRTRIPFGVLTFIIRSRKVVFTPANVGPRSTDLAPGAFTPVHSVPIFLESTKSRLN